MKRNKGFDIVGVIIVLAIIAFLGMIVAVAIDDTKERTPAEEREYCLDKINIGVALKDLPARCLKYVEIPDNLPIEERW